MRIITGRVALMCSGMIAGVASSIVQGSTALSVALIGGVFYSLMGRWHDAAAPPAAQAWARCMNWSSRTTMSAA
jgi:hypothetical protein